MLQMLWIHMNADRIRSGRRNGVQCFVSPLSDLFYPTFLHGPALYKNPQMPDSPASKIYKYSQTSFKWIPRPRRMLGCLVVRIVRIVSRDIRPAQGRRHQGWQWPIHFPGALDVSEPGKTMGKIRRQGPKKGRNCQIAAVKQNLKRGLKQMLLNPCHPCGSEAMPPLGQFTLQTLSQTCKLWEQFRPVLKVTTPKSVN